MASGDELPQAGPTGSLSLSRSVEKALEEAANSGVLNLSNRKLREFPRAATNYDLSDLTQADLSKNRLSEIPCEICQYISLETLNLYHNSVRSIPRAITNLQALTYLNVSRSHLCVLPPYLCCLPLKVLIASNNKLTTLPEDIGCLSQLRELDVSCNDIHVLPSQIGNLESLRDLNVRRNQLASLPEELSELPLVRLDFSCNKISRIPVCYRHLRHLQYILMDNNPLQSPPAQICTKGKIHIFKYLNIEACKIVPDLTDLERSIQPQGSSSCLSDEFCPNRQHSGLDSGFNSVDSGTKRWSGNESTDEFTELSLRMVEISREQKLLRGSHSSGIPDTNGEQDLEQVDFIDSSVEEDSKSEMVSTSFTSNSPSISRQDNKLNQSSTEKTKLIDRVPPNGLSRELPPSKQDLHREGEERRRPETLQIWQEREKQLQTQALERRERGVSVSSISRIPALSDLNVKDPPSGVTAGNSVTGPSLQQSESQPGNSSSSSSAAANPTVGVSVSVPLTQREGSTVSRPNSFLFRSSTRSNIRASSVVSPMSPQSPSFPESDPNAAVRQRLPEEGPDDSELVFQLRKSIESRLNQTLPDDLGEALNNGVTLCQLVNQIRPRSISVIHIPSPAVPKLSLAKRRRNVDSFLEACRKVGVPQPALCLPCDVLLGKLQTVGRTVAFLLDCVEPPASGSPHQLAAFSVFYICLMSLLYLLYSHLPSF
ncbi:leucine-rich repeat and calponin homology domain-containing protein 4-like isoform X2 [Hemiscyllium ocellatum]|uniref:leucine-rich repeat and calponin homology domain-containing protein 4-like isoform X2 n=1 Tax=Hemiscyllium ocellatum TaxID=170820 RepID=UPI0029660442|nr:leucine-rich repeat and calponin homology domain-containing protein 4-like isoform X2 [Hemiscyllium ocellatum]